MVLTFFQKLIIGIAVVFFVFFLLEFIPFKNKYNYINSDLQEEFDPSLLRLNNLEKIERYCDSVTSAYLSENSSLSKDSLFAAVTSMVIRKRFIHGMAEYRVGNNFMALFLQPLFPNKSVTPMVDINEVLKEPNAICGQQSRVFAAIISGKKIPVKKVLFDHPQYGGHFALEIFYQNSWHFFDPDREPDLLTIYNGTRPSLEVLKNNPSLITHAYRNKDSAMAVELFKTAQSTYLEKKEGANLLLYQKITKIMSYTLWIFFLLLFLSIRKINLNRNRKVA